MSIPGKLLIALLAALAVSIAYGFINPQLTLALLFAPTAAAAILAVVLSHRALPMPSGLAGDSKAAGVPDAAADAATRQQAKSAAPARTAGDQGRKRSKGSNSGKGGGAGRGGDANRRSEGSPRPSGNKRAGTGEPQAAARTEQAAQPAQKEAAGPSETGTVKWFNATKGFGFIIRENGEEIFVHHRSILGDGRRSLRDGAPVSFRVVTTDKGPQAEDVTALD